LSNIGLVYEHQARYTGALENYQQALAILREVGDRAGEGTTLNNIGAVYRNQGRYAEALEAYQRALAIAREVGDRTGEGRTLNNIGAVHDDQGRNAEALEAYQQALAIRREVDDRAGEGKTLNDIGGVYYAQGRYAEALEALQQALAIRREVGDRVGEGATLDNIGRVHQEQNEPDRAQAYYEQAMDVFESLRAVAGSEAGRTGFIAQYASLYDHAIALYHRQGQVEQAFYASERGRARAFLDSLATGHVELSDNAAADLLAQEQEAYSAREATQDALARARAQQPPDPALVADLEEQLAQAEEEHQAALEAIEARGGQLAALVPGRSTVLDLPQVEALLDQQTTLISFWVLGDQTLAFVVTHDDFRTVALEVSQDDLTTQIRAFRSFPNLEVAYPESAVTLYDELIAPLKTYMTTPHLAIVPHSVLHYLPFAALTDGQRYLVDDYTITYLPSASFTTGHFFGRLTHGML
jgi:Tfp pilus assembly protein PilF